MNIKEKIQKSFKPCKRLKLLEYSEFLEKEELCDSPTSRAMYCEYKSQVDEKNQKADLCLSQKIGGFLFAIVLTIVIVCLFINQVSATAYYGWSENDYTTDYSPSEFVFGDWYPDGTNNYPAMYQSYQMYSIQYDGVYFCIYPISCTNGNMSKDGFVLNSIEDFQQFLTAQNISTYSQFETFINNYDAEFNSGNTRAPLCGYYITNQNFNDLLTYKQYTQTDIENSLSQGYQDGINDAILLYNEYWRPKGYETYPDNGSFSTLVSQMNNIGIYATDEYNKGINLGLSQGKIEFMKSQEYLDILASEYQKGKTKGEETAPLFKTAIFSFLNAPVNVISKLLNFEIFGVNLYSIFTFLLTISILFFVIKRIMGI